MEKQTLSSSSKKYSLIVARLKNGTATLSQVTTFFYLTNEQQQELKQAATEGQILADFNCSTTPSRPYRSTYRTAGL